MTEIQESPAEQAERWRYPRSQAEFRTRVFDHWASVILFTPNRYAGLTKGWKMEPLFGDPVYRHWRWCKHLGPIGLCVRWISVDGDYEERADHGGNRDWAH